MCFPRLINALRYSAVCDIARNTAARCTKVSVLAGGPWRFATTNNRRPGVLMRYSNSVLPAVVALLAAGAVVACSTTPRRSEAQRAADADIAGRVQATLLADANIFARHIDVEVDAGVVHLGGYVWEDEDFQTARRDAASVPGVKTVVDEMELTRGGLAGTGR
jgi:hypothetical protein